ncbi:hypothetical protein [Microbacterium sp. CIAB417]|uniref:hypothetical protein n=1 Tax=Microbacterium sp. CIAB417 TaxID=2860287 RepID=UPI001FAE2C75|nr:hypothetical protein [Microbacterium sp. CIAB417]
MTEAAFPASAFSYRSAREAGIGRGVLQGSRFIAPFHGVRAQRSEPHPEIDELMLLCHWYLPRLGEGQFFSHSTALALYGAAVPPQDARAVHVSVHRPSSPPRTRGVRGHRLQQRDSDIRRVGELPVEAPERAWVQASRTWTTDDLIVAADHLVRRDRPLTTIHALQTEALRMRGDVLGEPLSLIREGSESARETLLRLVLVRAGLPEPELNAPLRDAQGRIIARLDESFPAYRVAVEYDGRQHAFSVTQFRRDADRWDAIRDAGWHLVRILDHHLSPDPGIAVAKVRAALTAQGWKDHGRRSAL